MDIRSLSLAVLAAAMASVSVGCQKTGVNEEKEVWPALTEGLDGSAAYYGDYYGTGLGLFRVTISDSGLTYDLGQDCYVGEGEILSVYLNTPLPANANDAGIPAGEYSEGTGEYTFFNDGFHTSIVSEYDGTGNLKVKRVLSGNVSVKESVGIYWIRCDLLVGDEEEEEIVPFTREFVGKINVVNNSGDGFISNLSGDVQCLPMTYAEFVYQDINTAAASKTFSLFMATDYDPVEGSFDGDALLVYLNTGITDDLPAEGTYTSVPEPSGDLLPGTFIPGSGSFESNSGTWYYSYQRQLYAQMKGGSIRITRSSDGTYGVTAAFKDGNGHTVTASYSGEIELY